MVKNNHSVTFKKIKKTDFELVSDTKFHSLIDEHSEKAGFTYGSIIDINNELEELHLNNMTHSVERLLTNGNEYAVLTS